MSPARRVLKEHWASRGDAPHRPIADRDLALRPEDDELALRWTAPAGGACVLTLRSHADVDTVSGVRSRDHGKVFLGVRSEQPLLRHPRIISSSVVDPRPRSDVAGRVARFFRRDTIDHRLLSWRPLHKL